jgi:predicted transcriptional regulator
MLLSIRPRFAESILAGTKQAEIRRQRPSAPSGTPVIIYATKPVAAIIGTAHVESVLFGPPSSLWRSHKSQMGVTREEFDEYLAGVSTAYLLILTDARQLPCPLTLEDMRESAAFHPPRSYRYLDQSALRTLVNGHPGGLSLLSLLRTEELFSSI